MYRQKASSSSGSRLAFVRFVGSLFAFVWSSSSSFRVFVGPYSKCSKAPSTFIKKSLSTATSFPSSRVVVVVVQRRRNQDGGPRRRLAVCDARDALLRDRRVTVSRRRCRRSFPDFFVDFDGDHHFHRGSSVPFFFCLTVVGPVALLAVLRAKRALTMRSLRRNGIATMANRRKRIGWSLSDVVSTRTPPTRPRRSGREDFEAKEEREGKMHLVDRIEGWMSGSEEAWSLASGSGSTSRMETAAASDARSHSVKNKRIFGATSSLFTGSCPFAHVGSSESARKILKEGGTEKMPAYSAFKRFAGNGLFTCANEEEWHEKRGGGVESVRKGWRREVEESRGEVGERVSERD